jgi:hypothetical protein
MSTITNKYSEMTSNMWAIIVALDEIERMIVDRPTDETLIERKNNIVAVLVSEVRKHYNRRETK